MAERKSVKSSTRKRATDGEARLSTLDPIKVATRAYERFLERGRVHGHDLEDWLAAEQELRGN